ncbi:MAG: hypothetical protein NVS9B6_17460 [Candidatus Limnocylindrales bacterium]
MKRTRAPACLLAATLMLTACGPAPKGIPIIPSRPPHPASGACDNLSPPSVVFFAKETAPEEVDGMNQFAADWGARQHCFDGVVLTTLAGADLSRYRVLVIDVAPGQRIDPAERAAIDAFRATGRRVAIFAWPLALPERTQIVNTLGGVEAEPGFGSVRVRAILGCGDWQLTEAPRQPFPMQSSSYRYENFGDALFAVAADGPQRLWASTLFCPDLAPVMVEVPAGLVAGFYLGYTISLADNNIRSLGLKRLLVDVIHTLAAPAGF